MPMATGAALSLKLADPFVSKKLRDGIEKALSAELDPLTKDPVTHRPDPLRIVNPVTGLPDLPQRPKSAYDMADTILELIRDILLPLFQDIDAVHTAHTHPIAAQPATSVVSGVAATVPIAIPGLPLPMFPVTGTAAGTVTGTTAPPAG